ncbi:MAG: hypothetical protein V1245_04170 [Arenicellales bacterium]|nr:hypothetical protein [Arenicellales bacterium]
MTRLILSAAILLLTCNTSWSQSDTPAPVTVSAAQIGHSLLLALEIPASIAATVSDDTLAVRLRALAGMLKDVARVVILPEAAGCRRMGGEAIAHTKPDAALGPRISAGWEFECATPEVLGVLEIKLFSLLSVESIRAIVFPDGQFIITPDHPYLPL